MSHVAPFTVESGESLKYQVRCDEGIGGIGRKINCTTPPRLVLDFAFVLDQSQRWEKCCSVYVRGHPH
jgi:hypothetical protein